ncbi:glycoside hydrolase family 78 protein [Mangrovibacterium lignilyticum]|uniref:glycoside hydrolase family 78 protein n=1 Tax=Mangrovibacterium lignilyticum TaxID=2668052 RepID=UPI0013D09D84|nr:glycoside hydrolase family 78 protein [Mangrovibacterium lignilyticum]
MKQLTFLLFSLSLFFACSSPKNRIEVSECSLEGFSVRLALIETLHPQFSWKMQSDFGGTNQFAYQIEVGFDSKDLETNQVWNSGKIESKQAQLIPYGGEALKAGDRYFWKVKVWDEKGNESAWSEVSSFQVGLPNKADWDGAKWIGYEELTADKRLVEGVSGYGDVSKDKVEERAIVPLFRKEFAVDKSIASATLFVSGLGQYEASLNGQKVGDAFLAPGWTHYDKTALYNSYDVTELLQNGDNVLGAIVGNTFHYNNRERYRKLIIAYGFPKLICKLQLKYADGRIQTVISDDSWKTSPSPITYSGIYGGEDYDATLEQSGWNKASFDDQAWQPVKLVQSPAGQLKADLNYPIKVMETFNPITIKQINDTVWVYDFGQNASGIIDVTLKGEKGQTVKFSPGESLKEDGTVSQRGSGSPYYYKYTLNGEGEESWQPRFSYVGFRYVQIEGAHPDSVRSQLPALLKIQSLHTRNSAPQVGTFECSNELFNRTFDLINWGIKSNLQSVMTDCPTREKLGWIEQTQLMGTSVHFNFDIYKLYQKLIADMEDAQTEKGLVPSIVPEYINFEYYDAAFRDSPEWGSASIILPWLIYKWYGDAEVMTQAWPMMQRYMSYLESKADNNILSHGLGDWYDVGPNEPGYAQLTPVPLVATATYFYDAQLMAKVAAKLDKKDQADHFEELAQKIKAAFNNKFYKPDSAIYATGSQTSMAMPLSLGLVDKANEAKVLENLVAKIDVDNKAITAGDVGFHYLVDALTRFGKSELLYEMNNRDDVPGYGYQLKMRATSLAESWQALPSKSLNHLMLGHLMEWFYQGLGGIRQAENSLAYKSIVIQPEIVDELTYANVSFDSPYGTIVSNWKKNEDSFMLHVEIPVNTTAKVILPFEGEVEARALQPSENGIELMKLQEKVTGNSVCEIQSGSYEFEIKIKQ